MSVNRPRRKLTLDETVTYKIAVSGNLEEAQLGWVDAAMITSNNDLESPISTVSGSFDQAALHGLLRHLYSRGFPLISVNLFDLSEGSDGGQSTV